MEYFFFSQPLLLGPKRQSKRGIKKFIESQAISVIGVSPTHTHPTWTFSISKELLVPFDSSGLFKRSQDLETAYVVNGAFFLAKTDLLRSQKTFYAKHLVPLIMNSRKEALEIDDEWDFKLAEFLTSIDE